MTKTIVFTGGGSAGHVTPNMALFPQLLSEGYDIHYIGTENERRTKMKTTIEWFKPEEKKPRNGEVLALCATGYITTLNVYDGHFNCSCGDNFETEIEVIMWAYAPKRLKDVANVRWMAKYDKN